MSLPERLAALEKSFYCVCFSMRSGSTLLCHDLTQLGVGAPAEYFQPPMYRGRPAGETLADYVVRMVEQSPGDTFGFKISWEQTYALTEYLRREGQDVPGLDLRNVFPDLRHVHIVRRDKVLQAVSLWRALDSGTWHVPTQEPGEAGRPDYDFDAIRSCLFQLLSEDWLWTTHLDSLGIPYHKVDYESYSDRRRETLADLLTFLGGAVGQGPLQDQLRVMRDDWADEMAARVWADLSAPAHPLWAFPVPPDSVPASF